MGKMGSPDSTLHTERKSKYPDKISGCQKHWLHREGALSRTLQVADVTCIYTALGIMAVKISGQGRWPCSIRSEECERAMEIDATVSL